MNQQEFSAVTPEFERLAKLCESHDVIDPELYTKYQVKPGKGAAFVRTKYKNIITGAIRETSFNPTAKFDSAYIERKDMDYS